MAITYPKFMITPCCSSDGVAIEDFISIGYEPIFDLLPGTFIYEGLEQTVNGIQFKPGHCYTIISLGSFSNLIGTIFNFASFNSVPVESCDSLNCLSCDNESYCFELTSCNGTSQSIIISNSQELYNHYVNNNIVTLLGYEGCWEINTYEDCECAVSVTVLTSHSSCQECLPIVNYKFTSCDNQSIIRYSTDDYSAYVGKTVELECGGCWFVSEIDFVPPSTQTIDILYTFDSCSACAKTYYKLTNCTDDTQVIYTDSVLNLQLPQISTFNASPDPNPVPTNCNCIKVTYDVIGQEPVTVEVQEEDGSFIFNGYELSCNDNVWSVSDEDGGCEDCNDCARVAYVIDGVMYSVNLPFTQQINNANAYELFDVELDGIGLIDYLGLYYSGERWIVNFGSDLLYSGLWEVSECPPSPLSYAVIGSSYEFETVTTTECDCTPTTYATLTASCDCAVGTYTIPENSVFTSFVVELCSLPSNTVISIQECPGCFIVEPTRTPVNPVKVTLVEVFTDCLNCLPTPPQPVVISQPKRKIKPGYSVPTCDIRTYEKITCKSSEILYKQVLQLKYGISNCCPEEDEKWLIKKELIDLVSLIDPNYICKPNTSCCNQPINDCGCNTLKTCNSQ